MEFALSLWELAYVIRKNCFWGVRMGGTYVFVEIARLSAFSEVVVVRLLEWTVL